MNKILYTYAKKNTKMNLASENEIKEFKEEYRKFLNTLWNALEKNEIKYTKKPKRGPYFDPDSFSGKKRGNKLFYEDLCEFLNSKSKTRKYTYEANFIKCLGVELYSDQFGFSAPCTNLNHVYDKYLEVSQKLGKDKDLAIEKVINWVMKTRTVGGSFIWPKPNDWEKTYNLLRGGSCYKGSYIEDRVDLTLLEIRHYFKKTSQEPEILPNCNLECKWLNSFKSFENYVDELGFNSFVDKNYMPYDILESNFSEGKRVVIKENKVDYKKKKSLYKIENEEDYLNMLERMFDNVTLLIEERFNKS